MTRAVLLDLDGVIRQFDFEYASDIENRYGLEPVSLMGAAFTGPQTEDMARALHAGRKGPAYRAQGRCPGQRTRVAKSAGQINLTLLDICDQVRADGLTTGVLTNRPDTSIFQ